MDTTRTHDLLNRRRRTIRQSTGKRISPQERDLLWFRKIQEHGPLSSDYLHAYSKHRWTSGKRARDRLTDLFNEDNTAHGGAYLARPWQQFKTLDAHSQPLVYDLESAAIRALKERDLVSDNPRTHGGAWWHNHLVASFTASIELSTLENPSITYIPQLQILERANTVLRYPISIREPGKKQHHTIDLIPDALFGLEYQNGDQPTYRFYAVEVDRGTEPSVSSNWNRKSHLRSLMQYQEYVCGRLYRKHLHLTAPLLVLNVFTNDVTMKRVMKLVKTQFPHLQVPMLFRATDKFFRLTGNQFSSFHMNDHWTRVCQPSIGLVTS